MVPYYNKASKQSTLYTIKKNYVDNMRTLNVNRSVRLQENLQGAPLSCTVLM